MPYRRVRVRSRRWLAIVLAAMALVAVPLAPPALAALEGQTNPVFFPTQDVGTTTTQAVTVTNTGIAALTVNNVTVTGTHATDFNTTGVGCKGITVNPGDSCTLFVAFTPSATGTRVAALEFNHPPDPPSILNLQGNGGTGTGGGSGGTDPLVGVAPGGISFEDQPVGITSFPQSVTITNTGGGVLDIENVSIGGSDRDHFSKSADTCSDVKLQASQSCTVGVTFHPKSSGSKDAHLTIESDADGSPHKVKITGRGVKPLVTFSPPGVSFGIEPVGITTVPIGVTVLNTGDGILRITSATIGGVDRGDFAKSADTCSGASLAPGTSCSVGVTFTPLTAGSRIGTLRISQNASSDIDELLLTGIGAAPAVTFSPPGLVFGDQALDDTSSPLTVTVTNNGTAITNVSAVLITGAHLKDFSLSANTCTGRRLLPGASCTVGVTFTPGASGARTATLTVVSDAPGSPHTMLLRGGLGPPIVEPIVGMAATPSGLGYWLVARDGGVFAFGDAKFLGSMGGTRLKEPIVGMAATPSGLGYWLVAGDGGIFAFGDAQFRGSTGNIVLAKPIVGMTAMPFGAGYWLVASDGGVFSFGDARFFGSTGALQLSRPIVGMAASPFGGGYWTVASDGGVFAFGEASFFGSTGNIRLVQPVVGIARNRTGAGYWLVAADGGVFSFGDARFHGSIGGSVLKQPVVGMAATPSGNGYWFVGSDGGVFAFGDAPFLGSASR